MAAFNEAQLEQSIIDLMVTEGWTYTPGENIVRKPDEVIIADELRSFLYDRYKSEGITEQEVEAAIFALSASENADLYSAE